MVTAQSCLNNISRTTRIETPIVRAGIRDAATVSRTFPGQQGLKHGIGPFVAGVIELSHQSFQDNKD